MDAEQEREMQRLIIENKRLYALTLKLRGEIRCLQRRLKDSNRGAQTNAIINWKLQKQIAKCRGLLELHSIALPDHE